MDRGTAELADLVSDVARREDRGAYAALFRALAPRVKGYLRAKVPDAVAEELTQEVMLRVFRGAHLYDPRRGPVMTWIFTLARNCWIDMVRRERRPAVEGDPTDDPGVPATPEEALGAAQRQRALRRALDALPREQFEVIQGMYFGGQSFSEIATRQDVPLGTVKTRARLALSRLRTVFGAAPLKEET